MKYLSLDLYISSLNYEITKLERYIKSNGRVWDYPTEHEMLEYKLSKEEWDAEINDFLYGIEMYENGEMDQEQINHLKDMNYCRSMAWSIYEE